MKREDLTSSTREELEDAVLELAKTIENENKRIYPPTMNEELRAILSLQIYDTGPVVKVMRECGNEIAATIPMNPAAEQAFVLDFLIRLVLEYGPDWKKEFDLFMKPFLDQAKKLKELREQFNKEN